MSTNPYESPIDAQFIEAGNDAVRMKYLPHERAVQSISVLFYAGTIMLLLIFVLTLFMDAGIEARAGIGVCVLFFGSAYFAAAQGIQQLQPWARKVATLLTLPGLFGFPLGTVVAVFMLYLLFSKKGKFVFSEEYAQVRAATPHLDDVRRTSPVLYFFLVLVICSAGIVLLSVLFLYLAADNPV